MLTDIPFHQEPYSIASRRLTQDEIQQVVYLVERETRIFLDDPREWTLDGFLGFQIAKHVLVYQIEPDQMSAFVKACYESISDLRA